MSERDLLTVLSEWVESAPGSQDIKWGLRKYAMYKKLLFDSLHIKAGDAVRITEKWKGVTDKSSGWWHKRECLVPGATAIAVEVDYNLHYNYWYADIKLDSEWSVNEYPKGTLTRVPKTPDKRHLFAFPLDCLEALEEEKKELVS